MGQDDTRPQGARPKRGKKMNDVQSGPDHSDEEILRNFHDALDLAEAYLKRITKPNACEANSVDLLLRLRQSVTAQMSGHRHTAG